MKKSLITAAIIVAAASQTLWGVPARRDVTHRLQQPDGTTVELSLIGDERNHFYLTTDGIPVLADQDGKFCYATVSTDGILKISDIAAKNVEERTSAEISFVNKIDVNSTLNAISRRPNSFDEKMRKANSATGIGLSGEKFPHTGDRRALVILIQYSDVKFSMSDAADYYQDFLNGDNFTRDGGTGSCRQYFISSSANQFRPTFDAYGPVTLPQNRKYYGGNDRNGDDMRPGEMVADACRLLDDQIDFSQYDTDNDGYVDNIYVIYAGQGEASSGVADCIWPHQYYLQYAIGYTPEYDGKKINSYGCSNEYDVNSPMGIGTFCHEFGHVIGLPDLYDTEYGTAYARQMTPNWWSIMDQGSYVEDGRTPPSYSIFERNAMSWINTEVIDGEASITLKNIHDTNTGYVILTDKENEFFLLENRQQVGWDKGLPGHGLLIWHIDYNETVWRQNMPNNDATHQRIDIIEACNSTGSSKTVMAGYPFPGTSHVTFINSTSRPAMVTWSGKDLGLPLTNITETNGVISFDVAGGSYTLVAPTTRISDVNAGGFTLSWNAVDKAIDYVVNVYAKDNAGNKIPVTGFTDYITDKTTVTVSRLDGGTKYYATVAARRNEKPGPLSSEITVTTSAPVFTLTVPKVQEAINVSATEFTAKWAPVSGASDYLLTVTAYYAEGDDKITTGFGSGNKITLPEGWTSSTTSYYGSTSNGYYGSAAPSLKMANDGDNLTTATFQYDVATFSCWMRWAGMGTSASRVKIEGYTPADGKWIEIYNDIVNASADRNFTLSNIPAGVRAIRLTYSKSTGNLAIDDIEIALNMPKTGVIAGYDKRSVGNVQSHKVTGLSNEAMYYTYTVTAKASNGTYTLESDPMTVRLSGAGVNDIAVDSNSDIVSVNGNDITVAAKAGSTVTVCDLTGRTILVTTTGNEGITTFSLANGFYVVSTPTTAVKVAVK